MTYKRFHAPAINPLELEDDVKISCNFHLGRCRRQGLFRSADQGAAWIRLSDEHEFGSAPFLVGDMNVAGKIHMRGGRSVIAGMTLACRGPVR
jgi:hypothetical protein